MIKEQEFLQQAVELAREGMRTGKGGPFGCVIVKDNVVIGKGSNSVTELNDPTAHAEVVAIRDACKNIGDFQLTDCDIYTSCEPCPMCLGAIYWARPRKVFFAATRNDAAYAGFDDSFIYSELELSPGERKIPLLHTPHEEALKLFKEWIDKPDKQSY
jgi:guanine deaminase